MGTTADSPGENPQTRKGEGRGLGEGAQGSRGRGQEAELPQGAGSTSLRPQEPRTGRPPTSPPTVLAQFLTQSHTTHTRPSWRP